MAELLDSHVKDWLRITQGFGYKICAYKRVELTPDGKVLILYPSIEQLYGNRLVPSYEMPHNILTLKDEDIAPDSIRLVA